jgi:hypothetical protein
VPLRRGRRLGRTGPDVIYATPALRDAQNLSGWWPGAQFGEPSQVLGDGGEREFVLCTARAAQSKPTEPQDALQVREPHLDLLALTPRLLEALGTSERPGNVSGAPHGCRAGACVKVPLGSTAV